MKSYRSTASDKSGAGASAPLSERVMSSGTLGAGLNPLELFGRMQPAEHSPGPVTVSSRGVEAVSPPVSSEPETVAVARLRAELEATQVRLLSTWFGHSGL